MGSSGGAQPWILGGLVAGVIYAFFIHDRVDYSLLPWNRATGISKRSEREPGRAALRDDCLKQRHSLPRSLHALEQLASFCVIAANHYTLLSMLMPHRFIYSKLFIAPPWISPRTFIDRAGLTKSAIAPFRPDEHPSHCSCCCCCFRREG